MLLLAWIRGSGGVSRSTGNGGATADAPDKVRELEMEAVLSVVDHLVYVVPNLEQGMDRIEQLLGVRATLGGRHAHWRTRNALLGLGERTYLEIMAPDEQATDQTIVRSFGLDTLKEPRLATWAVRLGNLERVVAAAARHGVNLGEIQSGSRQKPDGVVLTWRLTDLRTNREEGTIPFFIDWGSSAHPTASAPQGCLLHGLKVSHPEPRRAVEAKIQTDRGEVMLR